MVPFETFWGRLKQLLMTGETGGGVRSISKWSMAGRSSGQFLILYRGGDSIICETEKGTVRNVGMAEFKKVYQCWDDYRRDLIGMATFVHDFKLHNATWVISILKEFEYLMS